METEYLTSSKPRWVNKRREMICESTAEEERARHIHPQSTSALIYLRVYRTSLLLLHASFGTEPSLTVCPFRCVPCDTQGPLSAGMCKCLCRYLSYLYEMYLIYLQRGNIGHCVLAKPFCLPGPERELNENMPRTGNPSAVSTVSTNRLSSNHDFSPAGHRLCE